MVTSSFDNPDWHSCCYCLTSISVAHDLIFLLLSALVFSLWSPSTSPSCVVTYYNVDAVYDSHVGNHARCVSHDVYFIFSVSIRASPCPSPPGFLLKLCVHDLEII